MSSETTPTTPLPIALSKTELVYRHVRARILDGRLGPGEHLSMDALARELGVSKIPIREAMGRLEAQGLVVQRQHAGPIVAPLDLRQLGGVYLARQAVEPLIARLAAERVTVRGLDELTGIQQAMRERNGGGGQAGLSSLNHAFHLELARATGLDIFVQFTDKLLSEVRRYRNTAALDRANWSQIIQEHDAILDALRQGDGARAAAAAADHASARAVYDTAGSDTAVSGPAGP